MKKKNKMLVEKAENYSPLFCFMKIRILSHCNIMDMPYLYSTFN